MNRFHTIVFAIALTTGLWAGAAGAAPETPAGESLKDRIRRTFSAVKEASPPRGSSAPAATSSPWPVAARPVVAPPTAGVITGSAGDPLLVPHPLFSLPIGTGDAAVSEAQTSGKPFSETGAFALTSRGHTVYLLDKAGRKVLELAPPFQTPRLLLRDTIGQLAFDGFALLPDSRVAIADNARRAVYLFNQNRFERAIGMVEDRLLFRNVRAVFADEAEGRFAVTDSAANRTFVFDRTGTLWWECPGLVEPVFLGDRLLRLEKTDREVKVQMIVPGGSVAGNLFSYHASPGHLILDAWVPGAVNGAVVLIVAEGQSDEDHADSSRVILYQNGAVRAWAIPALLDLELWFQLPYHLLADGGNLRLLQAEPGDGRITVSAFDLP